MTTTPLDARLEAMIDVVDVDDAVRLTQEIVRIPSVVGDEGELSDALTERMRGDGLRRGLPAGGPARAQQRDRRRRLGRPGPTLVLTGHIDTKPVCVGWDERPLLGPHRRTAGCYGHAVMDMKAGVAGARRRRRRPGPLPASLVRHGRRRGVVDHMGDQTGAIRFFDEHEADYCILAELTDLQIYLGHRGRLYWDVTSIGRSAHTCHRHRRRQRDRQDGAADRGGRGAALEPAGARRGSPSWSVPSSTRPSAASTAASPPAARR